MYRKKVPVTARWSDKENCCHVLTLYINIYIVLYYVSIVLFMTCNNCHNAELRETKYNRHFY